MPVIALRLRADAIDALSDKQQSLAKLVAAHRRPTGKGANDQIGKAPASAFVAAPTIGLASAQLESYLSKLVLTEHGSLVSSGVQQTDRAAAGESVRVQMIVDIAYEALQKFLYEAETGTPYVFVDSMAVKAQKKSTPALGAQSPNMRVTINFQAFWRRRLD